MGIIRRRYVFYGDVQGVGFRYHSKYAASEYGVTGFVHNQYDGTVLMEAQADIETLNMMINTISAGRFINIRDVDVKDIPPVEGERGFKVV